MQLERHGLTPCALEHGFHLLLRKTIMGDRVRSRVAARAMVVIIVLMLMGVAVSQGSTPFLLLLLPPELLLVFLRARGPVDHEQYTAWLQAVCQSLDRSGGVFEVVQRHADCYEVEIGEVRGEEGGVHGRGHEISVLGVHLGLGEALFARCGVVFFDHAF